MLNCCCLIIHYSLILLYKHLHNIFYCNKLYRNHSSNLSVKTQKVVWNNKVIYFIKYGKVVCCCTNEYTPLDKEGIIIPQDYNPTVPIYFTDNNNNLLLASPNNKLYVFAIRGSLTANIFTVSWIAA